MSEVQETRKPNRFRVTSIIIACLMLAGAFGVLIGPFTINVSAAPDTHTWDGGGANALASTKENWVDDVAVPETGDSVMFNAGMLSCTWDLAITLNTWSMSGTYSGIVTQAADFGTTGDQTFTAGTFTGSTSYVDSCGGSLTVTNTWTNGVSRIHMTGEEKTLALKTSSSPFGVQFSGNTTISTSWYLFYSGATYFIVDTGKTVTITVGKLTDLYINAATTIQNDGIINGPGYFRLVFASSNRAILFGAINAPVQIRLDGGAGASLTCSLSANTVFGSSLNVVSLHANYNMTLSHGSNYELTVAGAVTLETRGIMLQGTGAWAFGTFVQSGANSLFTQNGPFTTIGDQTFTAGTFTGSTSYVDSCGGDFSAPTGYLATGTIRLRMTRDGSTISYDWTEPTPPGPKLFGLQVSANITVTSSVVMIYETGATYLIVDSGKTLTINSSNELTYSPTATSEFTNNGTIAGLGSLRIQPYLADQMVTFGIVNCLVKIQSTYFADANRTITLAANTIFGASLLVESGHATYTCTLAPDSNTLTVAGDVTLGHLGLISGNSNLIMTGMNKSLNMRATQSLYDLNITSRISTQQLNVTNRISIGALGQITLNPLIDEGIAKYAGNPVVTSGTNYDFKDPCLFYEAGTWYMFYSYGIATMWQWGIGMATSTDFHTWTNYGLILNATEPYEGSSIAAPFLFKHDSIYYLFYQAQGLVFEICVATNTNISDIDGWVKYAMNPVIETGPAGSYDYGLVYDASVIEVSGVFRLYYVAGNLIGGGATPKLCLATSTDLFTWTKYPTNPIFTTKPLEAPNVMEYNGTYYIHCTMWDPGQFQYTALLISRNGIDWYINGNPAIVPEYAYETGRTALAPDNGTGSPGVYMLNDILKIAYQSAGVDNWSISIGEGVISFLPFAIYGTNFTTSTVSFSFIGGANLDYLKFTTTYLNLVATDSFILDRSDTTSFQASFSGLSLSVNISSSNYMRWVASKSDGTPVIFTLSGLESGTTYKVYVDDVIVATMVAAGGQISFDYSAWSTHTFEVVVPTTYEPPDDVSPAPSDKSPGTSDPGTTSFSWTSPALIAIVSCSVLVALVLLLRRPKGRSGTRHT